MHFRDHPYNNRVQGFFYMSLHFSHNPQSYDYHHSIFYKSINHNIKLILNFTFYKDKDDKW